ncbi:MAG: serine/threonine protein kinase [Planctomycetota bacterium]|nr:serine/threonine protein kinase [Planctomycetota bacterium]
MAREAPSRPAIASPAPRRLFGYDVVKPIGQGAGSTIYLVRGPLDGRTYAMKHVVRTEDKDIRFVEQLQAEHAAGQRVRHPGLRRTLEIFVTRNLLRRVTEAGLLMEMFDGKPLDVAKPSSVRKQVSIFIRAARALDALHCLGFVHCDLKPSNILVAEDGAVKVIDLGQAVRPGTAKSRIQGTPDYIAPEQVRCAPCTFQTDVFNFGATMYFTLTGRTMPTLYTVKQKENSFLLDAKIDAPHELNSAVPQTLSNLVMQCVRTNPTKRPAEMKDVLLRLETMRHAMVREVRDARGAAKGRPRVAVTA